MTDSLELAHKRTAEAISYAIDLARHEANADRSLEKREALVRLREAQFWHEAPNIEPVEFNIGSNDD